MKQDQKEVLKAWIDGAIIQYKELDGSWRDCNSFEYCEKVNFYKNDEYRIKPQLYVTETYISTYKDHEVTRHYTYSEPNSSKNLRLTWEDDKLVKAEVI